MIDNNKWSDHTFITDNVDQRSPQLTDREIQENIEIIDNYELSDTEMWDLIENGCLKASVQRT